MLIKCSSIEGQQMQFLADDLLLEGSDLPG